MATLLKIKRRFEDSILVGDWYEVKELRKGLYLVDEQDHVAFYVLKEGEKALFIDSGLGVSESKAKELIAYFQLKEFSVLATHAHCDHAGLNHLAKEVFVTEVEWNKYLALDEIKQIEPYQKMIGEDLPWPKDTKIEQKKWTPTRFLVDGETIKFGSWSLKVLLTPGHTVGHTVFTDSKNSIVFLGDFLVTGRNFLHLKDSRIDQYITSLDQLILAAKQMKSPILLPCHDLIPLPLDYLLTAQTVLKKISEGYLKPKNKWEEDELFLEAQVFEDAGFRVVIRSDQIPNLKPKS